MIENRRNIPAKPAGKMADSRMMDFAAFAQDIEAAYRGMWPGMVRKPGRDLCFLNGDTPGDDYAAGE